ncbi:helix-turn-helix domain-containing protein [Paenibacillus odorifer]|uniref:helix-turn-helix domain-containing protein n=1 Tax=Paenibacillus odorifer TaxID=189426 RepID=UPI002DB5A3A2|nr:helix-turn-helix domain-containing protein [Paenibacillus odorifer]MEC0131487.1 helix-turn-helix domain-containing protein [Paenibacillus odorifer]MEC0220360.1 helix-turn-helix domain-containing protein [Paenibacillus odorifer]
MLTLGGRIKNLREKKNIKQKDMAKLCGLTIVQLSRYETDDRKPDPEALKNIADALDTSGDYLLGRTNDPSPVRKETNMSFYGGPDNYTPDEIEEMEAALLRYREMKKRASEQSNQKL